MGSMREKPIVGVTCDVGPHARSGRAPCSVALAYEECIARAARYGQGDGAALMQKALDEGRRLGCATLWLSLWDQNHRAMAFYEKWGFAIVGTMPFLFGGVMYEDTVMARAL